MSLDFPTVDATKAVFQRDFAAPRGIHGYVHACKLFNFNDDLVNVRYKGLLENESPTNGKANREEDHEIEDVTIAKFPTAASPYNKKIDPEEGLGAMHRRHKCHLQAS